MSKKRKKPSRPLAAGMFDELVVDNFAGGGGASIGIETGLGRAVDVAINHDSHAVAMHAINHPHTRHHCEDVWVVDPVEATGGRPVGLAWFSPDCKHFSRAKGAKPVEKKIRGLAWVVVKWAKAVRPRVIMLENVREFETWGPLVEAKTKGGLLLIGKDGKPKMVPCPIRKGETFRRWIRSLKRLGYKVEWRSLNAADYGAPTHRRRLFLIARCDGLPIVWPAPTHGPGLLPYRTAAECIDWSLPCHSIFLTREQARPIGVIRPLAENTMRRIAMGVKRFVLDNPRPFIVNVNHGGQGFRGQSVADPLATLTGKHGFGLVAASLVQYNTEKSAGETRGLTVDQPIGVITPANRFALSTAFISKYFGGVVGQTVDQPLPTITAIDHNAIVAAALIKNNHGEKQWCDVNEPLRTIIAGGQHHALVSANLIQMNHGAKQWHAVDEPLHTITAVDRFGLVTVKIEGEPYAIVDLGLRMLSPRELYRCQGFPETYVIDRTRDGKRLPKDAQVRMVGNSVSPVMSEALVRANIVAFELAETARSLA